MCLAIPVKVASLTAGGGAIVDMDGVQKEVSLALVDGIRVGDYVIVHTGYALQKLNTVEAEKTLACMAGAVSDEPSFVLKSALGDDAYQPEVAPFFPMNFGQRPLPI